ncbi:MAG: ArsR/SmtB family transcription factor [Nanobdellota archaeon]
MKRNLTLFKALSDPTRYKILELLLEGERCVCEIFPYVERTQSTVSLQLGKLEDLGIVGSRREGKRIYYSLRDKKVYELFRAVGVERSDVPKKENCCVNEDG